MCERLSRFSRMNFQVGDGMAMSCACQGGWEVDVRVVMMVVEEVVVVLEEEEEGERSSNWHTYISL